MLSVRVGLHNFVQFWCTRCIKLNWPRDLSHGGAGVCGKDKGISSHKIIPASLEKTTDAIGGCCATEKCTVRSSKCISKRRLHRCHKCQEICHKSSSLNTVLCCAVLYRKIPTNDWSVYMLTYLMILSWICLCVSGTVADRLGLNRKSFSFHYLFSSWLVRYAPRESFFSPFSWKGGTPRQEQGWVRAR
jgi:hypothetical protein